MEFQHSGLISFRIAVQGTLKSLLQYYSSRVSILQLSAFFMVQLSHLYMTTEKKHSFDFKDFVGKVISLLFNMLFGFGIAFLLRSKCLNFMAAIICSDFGAPKIKSVTVCLFPPSICHEVMGPDAMILVF